MKSVYRKFASCLLVALSGVVATQSLAQVPIIQPGAPGQPGRIITAEEAADLASIQYSAGDVMFLQGMISHHAQAMAMYQADHRISTNAAKVAHVALSAPHSQNIVRASALLRSPSLIRLRLPS